MRNFPLKVGDKIRQSYWAAGRWLQLEWIGDDAVAGVYEDGKRDIYTGLGGWRPYVEPPVRHVYTVTTERRVPKRGGLYYNSTAQGFVQTNSDFLEKKLDVIIEVESTF